MEEWGFVDERELQGWKGGCVCITCQHFTYGVDQHCHTLLGCNLRQQQLQQGEHLKKKCKLWAPTRQKEMGGRLKLARQAKPPAFTEVISPLSEVQINCEQLSPTSF
jgi:hypothetical protein